MFFFSTKKIGTHVGTVDHIDGDYVKLAKKDSADGEHHWIPLDWIESVDNKTLYLKVNETEFRRGLLNEEPADARKVMN